MNSFHFRREWKYYASCFLPSTHYPLYDFDLRATHARTLLPAALASVSFGFVLVRVRVRCSSLNLSLLSSPVANCQLLSQRAQSRNRAKLHEEPKSVQSGSRNEISCISPNLDETKSRKKQPRAELELIQTQMAQKPMLRAEVGMRVRCANKASAE